MLNLKPPRHTPTLRGAAARDVERVAMIALLSL
jgi:hypothetical protein